MSAISFTKATRRATKLKIAVTGPSGSGKSLGVLALAHQLAPGGKIAAIDTENGSLSLYADRYPFDTIELGPPYLSTKYQAAITAAIEAGYDVLIIDSLSHQWDGDGGILQRKDEADTVPGTNHWTNWGPFTKEHNAFRARLLEAPIHVLATMRSKMAYQQAEMGSKKKIEKLGLQPIQREGMEYEFALTFDLQMDHKADASKDRTSLFAGKRTNLLDPTTGKALLDWLATAAPDDRPAPNRARDPEPLDQATVSRTSLDRALLYQLPGKASSWGGFGGSPLKDCRTHLLQGVAEWCGKQLVKEENPKIEELAEMVEVVLDARASGEIEEPEKAGELEGV